MKLSSLKTQKLFPTGELIAFKWLQPKIEIEGLGGFIIPESSYDLAPLPGQTDGLRVGRFYLGKILAIGPKVTGVKKDDILLVHEYSLRNYEGAWTKDYLYFIEEKECISTVDQFPEKGYFDLRKKISKKEIEEIMKGQTEGDAGSETGIPKDQLERTATGLDRVA